MHDGISKCIAICQRLNWLEMAAARQTVAMVATYQPIDNLPQCSMINVTDSVSVGMIVARHGYQRAMTPCREKEKLIVGRDQKSLREWDTRRIETNHTYNTRYPELDTSIKRNKHDDRSVCSFQHRATPSTDL